MNTMQYDYNQNGSREEVGMWHIHPLLNNMQRLETNMKDAYAKCFDALMSKSTDLNFWVNHCNQIAHSYELAKMKYEAHRRLEINWLNEAANKGKVA